MKRILLAALIVLAAVGFVVIAGGASSQSSSTGTYKIEMQNAFGLVAGADFKVAGARAGKLKKIELDPGCIGSSKNPGDPTKCNALITVDITQAGFGQFHSDAFCQSRPQSLIGEYFIDCNPGQSGKVLKPGSTIPVTRTRSTIAADLLNDIMRLPYRQRFSLIINELGAAVAARSDDLKDALRRAVPAIDATDNLLNLLANDSKTLQSLTASSNQVITTLANRSRDVQRFVTSSANLATDTAAQDNNLRLSFQKLPGFLEQLQPALVKLGQASDANTPVLINLNQAAGQLNRLFHDIPPFSAAALPSLRSLGQASVTGKSAVIAARPTINDLNQFAKPVPELAQNLAIVGADLDNRRRAAEPDPRSPKGQGYTGLEALLMYAFNQALAVNTFGPWGHQLAVDGFTDSKCSPYASPGTVANNLAFWGPQYRQCYAWLGKNQPGINETDPSAPSSCVPDPGGAPPGRPGPATSACKLSPLSPPPPGSSPLPVPLPLPSPLSSRPGGTAPQASTASTTSRSSGLAGTVGHVANSVGSASRPATKAAAASPNQARQATATQSQQASGGQTQQASGNQAQQLLNYLLAP